jgi:hypothetical protein
MNKLPDKNKTISSWLKGARDKSLNIQESGLSTCCNRSSGIPMGLERTDSKKFIR